MTSESLQELLIDVWCRVVSADEAWEIIDSNREAPSEHSNEYWLPIRN